MQHATSAGLPLFLIGDPTHPVHNKTSAANCSEQQQFVRDLHVAGARLCSCRAPFWPCELPAVISRASKPALEFLWRRCMASVRCHGDRCFGLPRLASPGVSWTTHYQVELPPDVIQWPQDQTLVGQKSWKMRRARGLLLRLAAAASRPAPAQGFIDASQAAAVGGRPQATAGAAGAGRGPAAPASSATAGNGTAAFCRLPRMRRHPAGRPAGGSQ